MENTIYKYQGAIHIHTVKSDGTADVEQIANYAKLAGLKWIIITDHNYIDNEEGYINGVLVIKGQEISPKSANHYLVVGTDKLFSPDNDLQYNINEVRRLGGFGFAAHPDEKDSRKNSVKPIKWLDKNITPDGVEIWNGFSEWGDKYDSRNIFTVAYSYLFRNGFLTKAYRTTLDWWDSLNNKFGNIVPAICGVDAHALKITDYLIPVEIFPYKSEFNTLVNEVILKEPLSKDFNIAKNQIINAIKSGNNTILNKQISKISPDIFISNLNEKGYSGDTITLDDNTFLNINLPKSYKIFVFKNGLQYNIHIGKSLILKLSETGKYRVEIHKNHKACAYSNPIILK